MSESALNPDRDLGQAVDAAIARGMSLLDTLTAEVDAAHVSALADIDEAVAAQGPAPGVEALTEFQRAVTGLSRDASERLFRQQGRLETFNLVLFGRTGAGKSSLIEALSGGTGAPISRGESDWTTDVREVRWGSCRLFDTPGIAGWGRTVARSELEARAEAAVADADVVFLCFDTQSQQEGEFGKVAEWIARYGKPALAVLNSRNGRWRFPPRVGRPSARQQLSRSVQEHATNIRDELSSIGLADVPVIAVHSKRAAFARTSDPYEGPDAPSRTKLRDEVGPEQLLAWSNLPALEAVLATALTEHAEELRLGMLREQARGLLRSSAEQIAERHSGPARVAAEQLERGVADVLALLGRPETEAFAAKLETLEALRGGGFAESATGEAEHHVRTRLSSRLRGPRARAIRRAERLVEQAFAERRDVDAAQFEEQVLTAATKDVEAVAGDLGREISDYLAQRLQLIAGDVNADLAAAVSDFAGARGSAGRGQRRWGLGAEVTAGAVTVGTGGVMLVTAILSSNPITLPVGIAIGVGALVTKLFGGRLRKQAAAKRERALATARAEARRSVIDSFDGMETELARAFATSFAESAAEQLGEQVDRALALRRLVASADHGTSTLMIAFDGIPVGGSSAHVLSDTAHLLQRTIHPGTPNADRLIWLGEDWCTDPLGLEPEDLESEPARTTAYDLRRSRRLMERMRRFARRASVRPRPGTGLEWLAAAHDELADDPEAVHHLGAADQLASDGRPQIVIAGDYSSGKSSFVKRLLVDAGEPAPEGLAVGAHPVTARAATFAWGDWNLTDTPGFQSSNADHADEAHQAIVGAAVVVLLFNANLIVGDRSDLAAVLAGDAVSGRVGKASRALFVVNRADELGVDPHDDLEAYEVLCGRKELELRQAIASIGGPSGQVLEVAEDQVLCTASDPYGMVGDAQDVGSGVYDEHRDWDGMDAFHDCLRQVTRDAMGNGVDVGVLEAGAAHLGNLVVARREELTDSLQRSAQQQRLLLDLDASLVSGRAIRESARDRLIATFVEMVARMYDDVSLTTDAATRTARIDRLESWSRDPEVEQRYREWSTAVAADLSAWREGTAERIERRLNAASFRSAFPVIEEAVDVGHLRPPNSNAVADVGKTVGKHGAEAAGSVSRESVTKFAHQIGQKFKPWGATKLTSKINVAGGALGVALGAWDLYNAWKSVRKEGEDEATEREVRSRVLSEVRNIAEGFFDSDEPDSAASTIDADLNAVEAVRADVVQRLEHRARDESQLRERIDRCQTQIQKALGAL